MTESAQRIIQAVYRERCRVRAERNMGLRQILFVAFRDPFRGLSPVLIYGIPCVWQIPEPMARNGIYAEADDGTIVEIRV